MRHRGYPFPFVARPWQEIVSFLQRVARDHPSLDHMAALAENIARSSAAGSLVGTTSMHDIVVTRPEMVEPPYDVIVVRAPGSLTPPSRDAVLIQHLTPSGNDDAIERPVSDTIPLFWRFAFEKWGIRGSSTAR